MPETPERKTPEADRLAGLSDAELIDEAGRYAKTLARMDEGQLLGLGGLLIAGAMMVIAILLAKEGVRAIRGETHPTLKSGLLRNA